MAYKFYTESDEWKEGIYKAEAIEEIARILNYKREDMQQTINSNMESITNECEQYASDQTWNAHNSWLVESHENDIRKAEAKIKFIDKLLDVLRKEI